MAPNIGRRPNSRLIGLAGFTTALIVAGLWMFTPVRAAQATKSGWWIKVQKSKQESPTITFSIGSNNRTIEYWRVWNSNDPLEFDVPERFRNINPLYIKAQSSGGRNSWFCMMYIRRCASCTGCRGLGLISRSAPTFFR
jgi:hypothetical protein